MASRQLKEKGWRPSAVEFGLGIAGLGGLAYGSHKAYKAYEGYKKVKDVAGTINSAYSPIIQMIPL